MSPVNPGAWRLNTSFFRPGGRQRASGQGRFGPVFVLL